MRREIKKIKKMQTIFKAIYPHTWYRVERLVDSQYPTDKIIRIVKGKLESMDRIEDMDAAYRTKAQTHDLRTETHGVCSDLISRADAMGAVQDHFNANGFKGYDDGQKMMDRIKALPSADREDYEKGYKDGQLAVMTGNDEKEFERGYRMGQAADRPTGEWLETESDEPCWYRCSECARRTDEASDYCPNCGAKMDKEENNE